MPKSVQLNAGLSLTNNLDVSGDVDINSIKPQGLLEVYNETDSVVKVVSNTATAYVQIQSNLTADTFGFAPNIKSKNESQVVHNYTWNSSSIQTGAWYTGVGKDQSIEGVTDVVKYHIGTGNKLGSSSKLVIDRDGNVGVGTTNPTHTLEVNGTVKGADFIGSPAVEASTLTETSNTALLAAGSYTLPNGATLGTKKLIVNASASTTIVPESITELADSSNDRNGPYSSINGMSYDTVNDDLYVVGNVVGWRDLDGGIGSGNIRRFAKWNGTTWSTVLDTASKAGFDNISRATFYYNGVVYIGGDFVNIVDQNNANPVLSRGFAKYDTSTNTFGAYGEPFGNNDSRVKAITQVGTDLYVGGQMVLLGSGLGGKVLKMDTSTDVFSLPTGSSSTEIYYNNGDVYALTNDGINVYAGGESSMRIGSGTAAHGLAVFNGSNWSRLTDGVSGNLGIGSGIVYALAYYNNKLYVGGTFTTLQDGTSSSKLAVFDTSTNTWSDIPNNPGFNSDITALKILDGKLYIAGKFTNFIAVYDPSDDSFTTPSLLSYNRQLFALENDGSGNIYVGGDFFGTGGSGVNKYTPASTTTVTQSTITGSFWESGSSTGSKTLTTLGEKLDVVWNGTYWFI